MGNWLFDDAELAERERVRRAGPEALPFTGAWLRRNGRKVYCYGAGRTLHIAFGALDGVEVSGIVDSDPSLWGKKILGRVIEPPASILADGDDAVVVVSVCSAAAMEAISGWCDENGVRRVDWNDVGNLSAAAKWRTDLESVPEAEALAGLWADELSRETYRVLMKTRASFSPARYPAPVPNQYFQDFVPRKFYRDFADLGAYRGDTLAAYREWMHDDFDAYYAFEALPENFTALRDSVSDARVRFFNCAVGDAGGIVRMRYEPSSLSAATIGDDGGMEVPMRTLDGLLADYPVGLVKMDIEGAEPAALRGAEKTIRRHKPALAISVYHQVEHLWRIPLWIRNVDPAYSLFLRHHSDQLGETVCYAVGADY